VNFPGQQGVGTGGGRIFVLRWTTFLRVLRVAAFN